MWPFLGSVWEEEGSKGVVKKVLTECASNRIEREGCKGREKGKRCMRREVIVITMKSWVIAIEAWVGYLRVPGRGVTPVSLQRPTVH